MFFKTSVRVWVEKIRPKPAMGSSRSGFILKAHTGLNFTKAKGAREVTNQSGTMIASTHKKLFIRGPAAHTNRWSCQSWLESKVSPALTKATKPLMSALPALKRNAVKSTKTMRVVRSRDCANWPSSRARSSRRSVGSSCRSSLVSADSANFACVVGCAQSLKAH